VEFLKHFRMWGFFETGIPCKNVPFSFSSILIWNQSPVEGEIQRSLLQRVKVHEPYNNYYRRQSEAKMDTKFTVYTRYMHNSQYITIFKMC
jgi:hypothetical protein